VKVRKLLAKGVDKNDYEIFEGVLDELLINAAKMVADSQS
jgi:hypothetical protein